MNTAVVLLILVIIVFLCLRSESYVDFVQSKTAAGDVIDAAITNGGFKESHIEDLRNILEPVMNDPKILDTVLEYATQDRIDEVTDILEIYFSRYTK
jgi:hypothetical protein